MKRLVPAGALMTLLAACAPEPTGPDPEGTGTPALAVASNTWLTRANMPGAQRYGPVAASAKNASGQSVLYVFGGRRIRADGTLGPQLNLVQAYNTATNSWNDRTSAPAVIEQSHGAHNIDGKIYIAGGMFGWNETVNHLLVYDPAADTWTRKRNVPVPGYAGASGAIGGKLYVLTWCTGGSGCDVDEYADDPLFFGSYDPATDQWTALPGPPSGSDHRHGVSGAMGGKLYVAGGLFSNSLEIYDPATNTWSAGAPMPFIRRYATAAVVAGKLYVMGGVRYDPATLTSTAVASTWRYDPATNTWTTLARAPRGGGGLASSRIEVNGQPRIALVGRERPGNNLQYVP